MTDVNVCDRNLLLALCVHNRIVLYNTVWSPKCGIYVPFDNVVHSDFLEYREGSAHYIDSRKLYKAFCIMCYLLECDTIVYQMLRELTHGNAQYPGLSDRSVVLLEQNLLFKPPAMYHRLMLDPNTYQSVKVGLELLWAWLKVLYIGDYHTLMINVNHHMTKPTKKVTHKKLKEYLNQSSSEPQNRLEWYVIQYVTRPKEWFLLHEDTRWVFQTPAVDW